MGLDPRLPSWRFLGARAPAPLAGASREAPVSVAHDRPRLDPREVLVLLGVALVASTVGVLVPAIALGARPGDALSAVVVAAIVVVVLAAVLVRLQERRAVPVRDRSGEELPQESPEN